MGVNPSPGRPPMVPLMPDIEITKLIMYLIIRLELRVFPNDTKVKIIIPSLFLI
jgi:hypothetical protein